MIKADKKKKVKQKEKELFHSCHYCLTDLKVIYLKNTENWAVKSKLNRIYKLIEEAMNMFSLYDTEDEIDYQLIIDKLKKALHEAQLLPFNERVKDDSYRLSSILLRLN